MENTTENQDSSILSLMGHDLKNRFAAIQTGLSMLERYGASDRGTRVLQRVTRQVAETVVWVEDLVRVSRQAAGTSTLPQTTDLVEVVEAAVERTRAGRHARGQTLTVTLPSQPIAVAAQRSVVEGMVGLLLIGASLRTPSGGLLRLAAAGGRCPVLLRLELYAADAARNLALVAPESLELGVVRVTAEGLGGRLVQEPGSGTLRATLRLELPPAGVTA